MFYCGNLYKRSQIDVNHLLYFAGFIYMSLFCSIQKDKVCFKGWIIINHGSKNKNEMKNDRLEYSLHVLN